MYAIGHPGQPPRLIVTTENTDALTSYMKAGEVVVPITGFGDYVISAGGEYVQTRTKSLDELKMEKWIATKEIRDAKIKYGAPVPNVGRFDMDDGSRVNLLGAREMAKDAIAANQPLTIGWKLADNTIIPLTAAQIIACTDAVSQIYAAVHAASQQIYLQIIAATTNEALDAIDINTGWPF